MEGKFPPFEEMDANGNLKGFNVDIANALCAEMKAKCKLVRFEWDELIPALKAQKADAILASMAITPERQTQVDFTNKYSHTPAFFFARKRRVPYVYITPKRIAGMKIGAQNGTTNDKYVSAVYAATSPIVRYESTKEMYAALVKGEIDLVLDDSVAGYYGFLQTPQGQNFEMVGSSIVEQKYFGEGAGIAVRKGDKALRERLNKALAAVLDNGVYLEVQRKYFIFNVY
ncbi:transporter substrate-binding domain-containing protein [Chitinimonas arctica]|nr:transporter substrate-binding domain-containing protein [Chitinimonas arctica]